MRAFRFTPEAKRHLSQIWHYSADLWGERRADKYLRAINETVRQVASGRRKARLCEEVGPRVLRAHSGSHHIYLRYEAQQDLYVVIGVLHQQMDPVRHLKEREQSDDEPD